LKQEFTFCCPCHFGLESVLKFELLQIGAKQLQVSDGRIVFTGDLSILARANLCLATAERVLLQLAEFDATTFEELYQGVKKIPLENYIAKTDAFPVKGHSLDSELHSVPTCQSIIKRAAVDRLAGAYHMSEFPETGATCRIQFSLQNNHAVIYLDTTGTGLHKRGYRENSNAAPIKETLAAGILDLARVRANSVVCDPCCGSGTFLIEAAMKALHIAPGINRMFAASNWGWVGKEVWREERTRAIDSVQRNAAFEAYGYDIDPTAVELTRQNIKKAGVASRIKIACAPVKDFVQPEDAITVCNPPYGERMLDVKAAEALYAEMGERFPADRAHPCYIISPHETFENHFGKPADKRRKLYNGMMKCQLYMYFK